MAYRITLLLALFAQAATFAAVADVPVAPAATQPVTNPRLIVAAEKGDVAAATALLKEGADVNVRSVVLISYIMRGRDWAVQNSVPLGSTPLHVALAVRRHELVPLLLKSGADVAAHDAEGWSPLVYAIRHGDIEQVNALLRAGLKLKDEPDALSRAVESRRPEVVRLLLDRGAEVNRGRTPALHMAVMLGQGDAAAILIKAGADIDQRSDSASRPPGDYTPLGLAVRFRQLEMCRILLRAGADVNRICNDSGRLPLGYAIEEDQTEIAAHLVVAADPRAMTRDCLLHLAAVRGHVPLLGPMVKRGVPLDGTDAAGRTALHVAVLARQLESVKTLLELGAPIDAKDKQGRTPLHMAAVEAAQVHSRVAWSLPPGQRPSPAVPLKRDDPRLREAKPAATTTEILSRLLNHNAKLNAMDSKGLTPLHLLCALDDPKAAEEICGIDVAPRTSGLNFGSATAWCTISTYRPDAVIRTLLEHGAKVNMRDKAGKLPIDYAGGDAVRAMLRAPASSPDR